MDQQNPRFYDQEDEEIDLGEIALLLWSNIRLLICSFIIGACVVFSATSLLMTPQYEATSMIYILSNTTSLSDRIDLQLGKQLTVDFETLATTREVIERVINNLQLDTTYEKLKKSIDVENPSDTQILKITARSTDPRLAKRIANSMANVTSERISEVMMTDKPTIGTSAVTPDKPTSPNTMKNTAIGGLIGLLLAAAYLIINYIVDDTIKTAENVEKYLDLSVLSLIPVDEGTGKNGKNRSRKGRREGKKSETTAASEKTQKRESKTSEPVVVELNDSKNKKAKDVEIIDITTGKERK